MMIIVIGKATEHNKFSDFDIYSGIFVLKM